MTDRKLTARKTFLWLHRWIGLLLGLVLVVIGLTGSILVWQRQIDAALNPALFRASGPADPAMTFATVQRIAEQASGKPAGQIRPPDAVWPVWVVTDRRTRGEGGFGSTHVDPATGAVLGRRDLGGSFIATVRQLHEALLLRAFSGREIVGWIGVFLFFSSLSGIYLWWPAGGGFLRAFTLVRRRPFVRFNLDLHAVVGIWIAAAMTVVAFSGVAIVFPGWIRPVLGIAEPTPPQRIERSERRAGPPVIDADRAVAAALAAAAPGQVVTTVGAPGGPGAAWNVTMRAATTDGEVRVRSMFLIDPASGAVLEERSPRTRSFAEDALAMQRWLHGGHLLGLPGRLLVFLAGLALPLLFVTGTLAWLARRRIRRRLAAQRSVAMAGQPAE